MSESEAHDQYVNEALWIPMQRILLVTVWSLATVCYGHISDLSCPERRTTLEPHWTGTYQVSLPADAAANLGGMSRSRVHLIAEEGPSCHLVLHCHWRPANRMMEKRSS